MGKITVEVKINAFGTMLYSLNHPILTCVPSINRRNKGEYLLYVTIQAKSDGT